MTAPDIDWAAYEDEIREASDPVAFARLCHPSGIPYAQRNDLTVVTRRPASETIRLADALTIWIARRFPEAGLLAMIQNWGPSQWAMVALAAGQPAPTSAVQCVVLAYVREAAK